MNAFSTRLKVLAATGLVAASLGAAALSGAFAAPRNIAQAASAPPTATAVATSGTEPSGSQPSGTQSNRPGPGRGEFGRGPWMGGQSLSALASFLGMSQSDLQTALQNHQTLAQISQAHGKSTADLKTFLTNQLKTQLDQQVASGKLTSQQEMNILNRASSHLDQMINGTFPKGRGPRGDRGPGPGFIGGPGVEQTVAQTLGMNASDVRSELQGGKTLAQIAQEHGKTAADLENALVNAYKAHLDQLMNQTLPQRPARSTTGSTGQAASTATPARSS